MNLVFCTLFLNKLFLAVLISNLIQAKNIKRMVEGKILENSAYSNFFKKIILLCKKYLAKPSDEPPKNKSKQDKVFKRAITSKNPTQKTASLQKSTKQKKSFKLIILQIQKHSYFYDFMMLTVISSLIFLAIDDPYQSQYSQNNLTFIILNVITFIIFTIELFFDLITHKNGYFSFAILTKSILCLSYLLSFTLNLKFLKVILIFRLFMLLHFSKELKLEFGALVRSIGDILQLFLFFFLICLLFALIGVKCFQGSFWHCDGLAEEFIKNVLSKQDCLDFGGDWINRDFNFDNVFNALETMFIVANAEGWTQIM